MENVFFFIISNIYTEEPFCFVVFNLGKQKVFSHINPFATQKTFTFGVYSDDYYRVLLNINRIFRHTNIHQKCLSTFLR